MHRTGEMEPGREDSLPGLLRELPDADDEHPDVAVSHESGWTLSVFRSLTTVLENVETDSAPCHRQAASEAECLTLMRLVARGHLHEVRLWDWSPGYPG